MIWLGHRKSDPWYTMFQFEARSFVRSGCNNTVIRRAYDTCGHVQYLPARLGTWRRSDAGEPLCNVWFFLAFLHCWVNVIVVGGVCSVRNYDLAGSTEYRCCCCLHCLLSTWGKKVAAFQCIDSSGTREPTNKHPHSCGRGGKLHFVSRSLSLGTHFLPWRQYRCVQCLALPDGVDQSPSKYVFAANLLKLWKQRLV